MSSEHRTIREIEHDLAAHRADLARGLDTLQRKLSVDGVVESVKNIAAQNAGDLTGAASKAVRSNPLAVTLIGIGLLWLVSGKSPAFPKRERVHSPKPAVTDPLEDWQDEGGAVWMQPEVALPKNSHTGKRPHWADTLIEE